MGYKCVVPGCLSKYGKTNNIHFRRFPLSRELAEKWLQKIGRDDLKAKSQRDLQDHYRICDKHFRPEDFVPFNNKAGSLLEANREPCLFLNNDVGKLGNIQGNTAMTDHKIKTGKQPVSMKPIKTATPSTISYTRPTGLTAAKPVSASERFKVKPCNDIVISTQRNVNNSKVHNSSNYVKVRSNISYAVYNSSPISGVAKADVRMPVVPVNKRQPEIIWVSENPLFLPKERVEDNMDVYQKLIDTMKKKIDKMKEEEKLCSILIGETKLNSIEGFQDNNSYPSLGNNDKVMIFMAKGIYGEWNTPLAYSFSKGGVDREKMLTAIRTVVRFCQKSGLSVRTLVCDQTVVSMAVFDKLYQETSHLGKKVFGIEICDQEIIPLYDVLSLFKGIRNDFCNSMVCFKWQRTCAQLAVWDHLKKLYEVNASQPCDLKVLKNLTLGHIEVQKEANVFKVAQIFSAEVASLMHTLARICDNSQRMPSDAVETAEFILFMDKLIDSVTGSKLHATKEKHLIGIVTPESPRLLVWKKAIQVFQSMEFLSIDEKVFSPSIKNWIHTLNGFIHIWNEVSNEGRSNLPLGGFNHETLEELFCEIRRIGMSYFSNIEIIDLS